MIPIALFKKFLSKQFIASVEDSNIAYNVAFLFNCTSLGRTSDFMEVLT